MQGLWEKIRANWSVPPTLKGKGYVTVLSFTWDRRGKLVGAIRVEKSSGNRSYDEAAFRAVERTGLQGDLAIPAFVAGETMELGVRFRSDSGP